MRDKAKNHTDLVGRIYWAAFLEFISPYLPCHNLLDAGCRDGELTEDLVEQASYVVGIDIQRSWDKPKDKVEFAIQDIRDPLPNRWKGFFDLITSFYVFQHMPSESALRKAFKYLAEGLSPTGHLCLAIPHPCFAPLMRLPSESNDLELACYMERGAKVTSKLSLTQIPDQERQVIELVEYHYPLSCYFDTSSPHLVLSRVAEPVVPDGILAEEGPLVTEIPFVLFLDFYLT